MKPTTPFFTLAAVLFVSSSFSFGQSNEAAALEKAKASLPPAIRDVAAKGDDAGTPVTPAAAKPAVKTTKKTTASTKKGNDPSTWGRNETHKLAVMDIDYGGSTRTVMFELRMDAAPRTVANFIDNCDIGAYKGLAFHRAIDNYLVQTGDPLTADDSKRNQWGTGGEDKTVPGEFSLPHQLGSVAMARRGDAVNPTRASNGYQFYFTLGNMSALNGSYTVFGQVVSGLEVLQEIAKFPVDSNDCPLQRIAVKSIKVVDQKGPLVVMHQAGLGRKRFTTPSSAKGPLVRFLERVW